MKDAAMLQLVQPVTELLNDKYAAVGILEHWDTSIRLFQHVLELPDYDWAKVIFFFFFKSLVGKEGGSG